MAMAAVVCTRTATLPSALKINSRKPLKSHPVIKRSPWLGCSMNMSRHLNLRASNCCKAHAAMAAYKVKLISPEGEEHEIDVPDDAYILESAENAGLDLPYSCRAGTCSTCTGLMVSGSVDQSEGSFLNESQMENGYVLTCISRPTSDCTIHTHKESEVQ